MREKALGPENLEVAVSLNNWTADTGFVLYLKGENYVYLTA